MQESGNFRERRVFTRFSVNIPATYVDPVLNNTVDAHTLDISAVGLCLLTYKKLDVGIALEIRLHNCEEITAKGKVIWIESTDDYKYRIGMKFDGPRLDPISLILKRIQSHINNNPPY